MSASLVGSEMCIRDSACSGCTPHTRRCPPGTPFRALGRRASRGRCASVHCNGPQLWPFSCCGKRK
eukprot:8853591-Alexandrium_andersonii.AAC.1